MHIKPLYAAMPALSAALFAAAVLAAVPLPAAASVPAPACVTVEDGWIRMPPAPRPMLAGFGRVTNRCEVEQAVVAVRSPRFGDVSLHETRMVDGVSRMRGIERLPVPAGGEAVMQPGGLHLMLMQPQGGALAENERVPLVLELADGREVPVVLVVRKTAP